MGHDGICDGAGYFKSCKMKSGPDIKTTASRHSGSRAFRWTIAIGALTMVAIGVVLLYLLTQATNNQDMYERNYAQLRSYIS